MIAYELVASAGTMLGGVLGWVGHAVLVHQPRPSLSDVEVYMRKVVNVEEAEERYNLTRKMLHDAKRRTMPRVNAGAPAKISRMRKRRTVARRREPLQPGNVE